MTEDELYQKLIAQSLSFVSIHPRSEKEILLFLHKKMERLHVQNSTLQAKIMGRLQELGYVNDRLFVQTYRENMMKNHTIGKRLLMQKLQQKGVTKDVIVDVLSEESDEREIEEEMGRKAVEKKVIRWKDLPLFDQRNKAYQYLARRGFEGNMVSKIIDEVFKKDYNTGIEET